MDYDGTKEKKTSKGESRQFKGELVKGDLRKGGRAGRGSITSMGKR